MNPSQQRSVGRILVPSTLPNRTLIVHSKRLIGIGSKSFLFAAYFAAFSRSKQPYISEGRNLEKQRKQTAKGRPDNQLSRQHIISAHFRCHDGA